MSDFIFDVNSQTITGYTGIGGDVEIPSQISSTPVLHLGNSVFYYNADLTSIVIPEGILSIGIATFANTSLTSVVFPDSLLTIGESAFETNQLTSVTFGNSLTSIGGVAFQGNLLTSIILPSSIEIIGYQAFTSNQLTSVTILNQSPTEPTFGNNVFASNPTFTMYGYAGSATEAYATNNSITFEALMSYTAEEYFSFNAGTQTITNYNVAGGLDVNIPPTIGGVDVLHIGNGSFQQKNLTSVIIPDSVTSIGQTVFKDNQLTSVTIPNSVTSIGSYAFHQNQLTSVTIPDSVTSIGQNAFAGLIPSQVTLGTGFTNYLLRSGTNNEILDGSICTLDVIPNNVTSIAELAFYENHLTSVTIPDSVTSIGISAFEFNHLTSVTIPDSVISIGHYAFQSNPLVSVTIGTGIEEIGEYAFCIPFISDDWYEHSDTLESVIILRDSSEYPTFGENVFSYTDDSFQTIVIPANLTMHGYTDSATETYALQEGTPFEVLSKIGGNEWNLAEEGGLPVKTKIISNNTYIQINIGDSILIKNNVGSARERTVVDIQLGSTIITLDETLDDEFIGEMGEGDNFDLFLLNTQNEEEEDMSDYIRYFNDIQLDLTKITNMADPTLAQDAATKAYVDAVAQGLIVKDAVRVATTESITLNDVQTIDGVLLVNGDRVLVKNQATPLENGIYVVVESDDWTRATDFDGTPEHEVKGGCFTFVQAGNTSAGTGWVVVADGILVVDVDAINFTQFSSAGVVIAGAGIEKDINTLNVLVDDSTLEINLSNELQVKDIGITKEKINEDVAGNGLLKALDGSLEVQVDDDTIEIDESGNVIVKDGGITYAKLASTLIDDDLTNGATPNQIPTSEAVVNLVAGTTYAETIEGNGSTKNFIVTHNKNTTDILCQVWEVSTKQLVNVITEATDANTVTIKFSKNIANEKQFRVVIKI